MSHKISPVLDKKSSCNFFIIYIYVSFLFSFSISVYKKKQKTCKNMAKQELKYKRLKVGHACCVCRNKKIKVYIFTFFFP